MLVRITVDCYSRQGNDDNIIKIIPVIVMTRNLLNNIILNFLSGMNEINDDSLTFWLSKYILQIYILACCWTDGKVQSNNNIKVQLRVREEILQPQNVQDDRTLSVQNVKPEFKLQNVRKVLGAEGTRVQVSPLVQDAM